MTQPASRSATSVAASGTCAFDRCMWYTNNITIPGPPTNTDPAKLTMRVAPGSAADIYANHPWRGPGSAPSLSPCGRNGFNHGAKFGVDGRDMPATALSLRKRWVAGTSVEVAFALTANHGGGYQYRLCPSGGDQTEQCFQNTPLEFHGNTTWVQVADRSSTRVATAAVRVTEGTVPAGSTWARNPLPNEPDWPEWPPPGGYWGHQNIPFNIFDRVKVPAHLAAGTYSLSWRWDCEQTKQVWANCADVEIVSGARKREHSEMEGAEKAREKKERQEQEVRQNAQLGLPSNRALPSGELVWKWSEADSGISGGAVLPGDGGVAFGSFLSTGSASPGTNKTFWTLDLPTGQTRWNVEVPTAVLYSSIVGDGVNGEDGVLYFGTLGPWVFAVKTSTGAVLWRSGGGVPAEYAEPADDFFSAPVVIGDTLYIGNYDNHLYALDTKTGATQWRYNAEGPCNGSPAADAARRIVVFVARSDLLIAVNSTDGSLVWKVHTTSMLSSPSIHGDMVLAGTLNGTAVGFDIATGRRKWTTGTGYGVGAVWALNGAPVFGGLAFFGADDGKMYALDIHHGGSIMWEFQTGAPIEAAPAVTADGVLVFGSLDYSLYAVNATTGQGLWRYDTGLYVSCMPAVGEDGTVFFGSYDGSFYAVRGPK